jgi:DNA primase
LNVEELLVSKDIVYTPKGGDCVIRCLSPDHEDRNPSLRIDRVTGVFNCLSCGFKGNIINHFGEKVNQLQLRRELLKKKLRLKKAETVGLSMPKDAIPYVGDWRNISSKTYRKFEAFQEHSSQYIGRIIFPVKNLTGRIVAFVGRHTTGGTPKYLISPAGAKMPLYPAASPIMGSIILVEGIFDMVNLHDKGLSNAVCCFGTRNINEDKLAMLKMQGVESVDIFFDGDDAGQKAAETVKIMCEHLEIPHRNIRLKDEDPGALTAHQVEKLKRKLYK